MKRFIKKLLREALTTNSVIVYRCIDGEYNTNHNSFEYFSVDKDYAEHFGDNCYEFKLNLVNAKILELEKWNKLFKDKTGFNGNKYNRIQGIFVVGQELVTTNYEEPLITFSKFFPNEVVNQFINELNNCDAIYGQEAGYPDNYAFVVKNKKIITQL
jgi:hypothetical protein